VTAREESNQTTIDNSQNQIGNHTDSDSKTLTDVLEQSLCVEDHHRFHLSENARSASALRNLLCFLEKRTCPPSGEWTSSVKARMSCSGERKHFAGVTKNALNIRLCGVMHSRFHGVFRQVKEKCGRN